MFSTSIAKFFATSRNVDYESFVDSTTEKLVGYTTGGTPIYERTFTGTATYTANTRVTLFTATGLFPIQATGYTVIPVDSNSTFVIPAGTSYRNATGNITAGTWYYSNNSGMLMSGYTIASGTGKYYIKTRYLKTAAY